MNTPDLIYLIVVVVASAGLAWVLLGPDDIGARPTPAPKQGRATFAVDVHAKLDSDGPWVKVGDGPWHRPHVWGEVVARVDGDRHLIHDGILGYSEARIDAGPLPVPAGTAIVARRCADGTYRAIQVGA